MAFNRTNLIALLWASYISCIIAITKAIRKAMNTWVEVKRYMPKTVSVSEAKNQLSAVMDWAVENGEDVVVESRGEPKVAILSYSEYQKFIVFKEQERRRLALRQLEVLAEQIWAQTADLSDEEADQLAEEVSQETIQRMVKEGKLRFQS